MKSIFTPQHYNIEDRIGVPFINRNEILEILENHKNATSSQVDDVISRSLAKNRLSLQECAILIGATDVDSIAKIMAAAKELKRKIYGDRIVLFAPLYVGNSCSNNCLYCGFRATNRDLERKTLTAVEFDKEIEALEDAGHKRLILVFGEHPTYSPEYIASCTRRAYSIRHNGGEIRRVNINAAPLSVEGFRTVKEAGIGTYQVFQETYDEQKYSKFHISGKKADYNFRLTAFDRAMEAGIDDVGLGALLGLGDPFFELMAMVRHVNHLEACFGVGAHTLSFPRIKAASGVDNSMFKEVTDEEFIRFIAILRLAVPYSGMILTARENSDLRREALELGISQIDGGTKIEIGGYSSLDSQNLNREQFLINDERTLHGVIHELTLTGHIPSFCTACYRKGRTGEHFMEFSVPGFIKRFCTPNAILSYAEYLEDYAADSLKEEGYALIAAKLDEMAEKDRARLCSELEQIRNGKRDLHY